MRKSSQIPSIILVDSSHKWEITFFGSALLAGNSKYRPPSARPNVPLRILRIWRILADFGTNETLLRPCQNREQNLIFIQFILKYEKSEILEQCQTNLGAVIG